MPARILTRARLLALQRQFRARYQRATPGRIVSVGLRQDGSRPFWRILVSRDFRAQGLPRSFAGLPVLVRKAPAGHLA